MPDQLTPTSERARKRAAGEIRREGLIKRRESYFDLLVSGYGIEQIASHTKKSPSAVRRAVAQALATRRLDAPEGYARIQVARLTKALPDVAPAAPPLALTHSPSAALTQLFEDEKLRKGAAKLLKSFVRVNLCAMGGRSPAGRKPRLFRR